MTKRKISVILLLVFVALLRFVNLGYSEFQDDEKKALIRKSEGQSTYNFFLQQRKGPMQFVVTSATLFFIDDYRNELALRLPFTVMNLISVFVFYLVLREIIDSHVPAMFGAFLYGLNGFIVGFSRIAQYQNINILFSLLSLYFFIHLGKNTKHLYRYAFGGVLAYSISLLAHWDAIFILIPIIYFYAVFLKRGDVEKKHKFRVTAISFLFGCLLLLPFLIPYIHTQTSSTANIEYFDRRVGFSDYPLERHEFIFELYNPFVAIFVLPYFGIVALTKFKHNYPYFLWFFFNFLAIALFMQKPGTHIYNYVIPLIVLGAFGFSFIYEKKRVFKYIFLAPTVLMLSFLYYQSYMIFVDHSKEYPWDSKVLVSRGDLHLQTPEYIDKEVLTFGFPHFRDWMNISQIIDNDPDQCSYITNEGKNISQIYVNTKYGIINDRPCYYIVDVVRPFVTEGRGAVFAKVHSKTPMHTYDRDGEVLTEVYRVGNKNYKD